MNAATEVARRPTTDTGAQYRRFWRWHFYAAFLVIPFVLWQGATGVLYLWHGQIADALWPQLRFVPPGETRSDCRSRSRSRTIPCAA